MPSNVQQSVEVRGLAGEGAAQVLRAGARILGVLFLLAMLSTIVLPLLWLVCATVKGKDDLFTSTFLPPHGHLTLDNYTQLFQQIPFLHLLCNSIFVASTSVTLQLLVCSMAGWALAQYRFGLRQPVMLLLLGTLVIPPQLLLAPLYGLVAHLGLMDNLWGLIMPATVNIFGVFLFFGAFRQVPLDLVQAARVDGASEFRIYRDIAFPIVRPVAGAFCLVSFMASWNAFLWPQIVLHNPARATLPVGLNQFLGLYSQQYGPLLAGTLLAILPVLVLFFLLQREFVAGLTAGAVKN